MNKREMIAQLRGDVDVARTEMTRMVSTAQKFSRNLSPNEKRRFNDLERQVLDAQERVDELTEQADADEAASQGARKYAPVDRDEYRVPPSQPSRIYAARRYGDGVTSEPQVYRSGPGGKSYFKDLFLARQRGDRDATDRLRRNDKMVAETRALTTVDGSAGEFVPPGWLMDAWVRYVRPGRVTANLATYNPMPPGTDVLNLPKMATGTAVSTQSPQNTAIQQTDATTGSIAAPVITIAGGQTVSMQLVDQSPLNVDDVILGDLASDYAMRMNIQCLSGTGATGQAMGLLTLAGTNPITWTNASPTVGGTGGLYAMLGQAISAVHTNRFMAPDSIIMHPKRWAWIESRSDTNNRPLVVPLAQGPMNAAGVAGDIAAQGLVGTMMGLSVYTDPSIPVNLGAGTNQDPIIVTRASDLFLWEAEPRAEAFEQTYAQQMSLFCRFFSYIAWQPGRYPKATSIITGTGLVDPVW